MSEELSIESKNYVTKALMASQEIHGGQAWCHRDPKKWALTAQHIILPVGSVSEFARNNNIARNLYYEIKAASLTFHGLDTHKTIMDKFSEAIDSGEIEVNENVLFKSVKGLQGLTDIHGKLTGTNVQKHVVEHVHTKQDFEDKEAELERKYQEMKQAEKESGAVIDVD